MRSMLLKQMLHASGNERIWCACKGVYSDINCLSSVSEFQMSSEKRYALENGDNLLLDVGDTDDLYWFVSELFKI
jgi:hypothetical protein